MRNAVVYREVQRKYNRIDLDDISDRKAKKTSYHCFAGVSSANIYFVLILARGILHLNYQLYKKKTLSIEASIFYAEPKYPKKMLHLPILLCMLYKMG
jgi:hypothetical protein